MRDIEQMAQRETKVMLFRLVRHLRSPPSHDWLRASGIVTGNIQSIREIGSDAFHEIVSYADR